MERLTGYDRGNVYQVSCFTGNGCAHTMTDQWSECDCCEHEQAVYRKLAAYEDTGLEPEEVTALKASVATFEAERDEYLKIIESIHKSLDFADKCRNEVRSLGELGVTNGLALGQIAVTLEHEF